MNWRVHWVYVVWPKPLQGEGVAGTGFEIALELSSCSLDFEGGIRGEASGTERSGGGIAAARVVAVALAEVVREARAGTVWRSRADHAANGKHGRLL